MSGETKTIGSVERSFDIVEVLVRLGEAGTSDIATELSLSKSTVYTHLNTLHAKGYLVKEDGSYRLSSRFLRVGAAVQNETALYKHGKGQVDELAERTGERSNLVIEEQGKGVCLHSSNAGGTTEDAMARGERHHMHTTATGKAILAHLPEPKVDEIIDTHGLPAFTEQTITSRAALDEELAEIRDTGIAIDDEEAVDGLRCLASPILVDNSPVGSISVSGPLRRFVDPDREKDLKEAVRETANVIQVDFVFG